MNAIQRVICVIKEEIDRIEAILDDFGDVTFYRLVSEQAGLEETLKHAEAAAEIQSKILLKSEYMAL